MKRIAFVAAAALLGTGCISTTTNNPPPAPSGTLDVAWNFQRYNWTNQSLLTYSCDMAGVDNVLLSSSTGQHLSVPCSDSLGDGATIPGVWIGTQTVTVTGRRGGVALFQSSAFTVTIVQGQLTRYPNTVEAFGLTGDLDVYANFLDQFGDVVPNWVTCSSVLVTSLSFELRDWAENVIASGSVSCRDPAGVSFAGADALDLDNYAIRMKAFRNATQIFDSATMALTPTCLRPAFDHLSDGDVWDVPLYDITANGSYGFCP